MKVNNKQLIPYSIYLAFMLSAAALGLCSKFMSPYAPIHTSEICIKTRACSETAQFASNSRSSVFVNTYPAFRPEALRTVNRAQIDASSDLCSDDNTNTSIEAPLSHYTKLDFPVPSGETYGFIDSKGVLQFRIFDRDSSSGSSIIRKARLSQQNSLISVLPSFSPTPVDTSHEDFGIIIPETYPNTSCSTLSPIFSQKGLYYTMSDCYKPDYYMYGRYPNSKPAFYPCDIYGRFIEGSFPVEPD